MRGVVEIYKNFGTPKEELISTSENLIVDGAGELFADLMTLPADGSSIASASALYDTSNFTVRAVSFGKAASAFLENAHGNSIVNSSGIQFVQIWVDASSATAPSSYFPKLYLPKEPSPLDEKLEYISSANFILGNSSGIPKIWEFGQNLNLIQYGTTVLGGAQNRLYFRAGAWPRSTGETIAIKYYDGTAIQNIVSAVSVTGNFNTVSSMDWRGFVYSTSTTNPLSGLVTSSTGSFSSTGEIIYSVTIAANDAKFTNLYGGITQIGLWGFDLKAMTCSGNVPPYTFHPYNNVFEYRLFAKKTFNANIVKISDSGGSPGINNYSDLTILWRIYVL